MRRIPLDAFDLLDPIARGGMGLVLRGEHRGLGMPVAIKVLSHARARQDRAIAAFQREVRAMASLDHPAIVRVLDHGVVPATAAVADPEHLVEGSPYLVMELAHGTLDHPAPARLWSRTRAVLRTLLDALAHAHARGLVHRDLKPANVLRVRLRDGSSVLKLSDFGLAHALGTDPADERGAAAGTPQMMAPEQFRGAVRDFGPWTDLYALGCIAFKLATGKPPFDHPDEDELAHMHLRSPPPRLVPLFPVPDAFEAWVGRLLEKSPDRRFQRASDAARALLAVDEGEPVSTSTVVPALPVVTSSPGTEVETAPATELRVDFGDDEREEPPSDAESVVATLEDLPALAAIVAAPTPLPTDVSIPAGLVDSTQPREESLPDWRRPGSSNEPGWVGAALSLWGLRQPPFVARESEREQCWRALERVCQDGRARAVVLRGPSGFGKSRLVEWLCERAHEVGAATPLHAVHEPVASSASGLPRMIGSHLRTLGLTRGGVLARVRRALPSEDSATCEAITDLLAPRDDRGVTSASARLAMVRRVLGQLGRERPLVVRLDDVQWGGEAIALAQSILEAQGDQPTPILFVLTAQEDALAERPVEWAQLASLSGREEVTEIEIGPLPPDAHRALVERLLGTQGELAKRVAERTAGHPLFAVQLVGDWVERGILEPSAQGLRMREGASAELPDDLHSVWRARLAHLLGEHEREAGAGAARRALEILALAGGRADAAFLASACDAAGLPYPAAAIDRLLQSRMLLLLDESEGGDGITLELVHGLLRETLERSARDERRAASHHAAIANALETRYHGGETGAAERLATHRLLGGDPAGALAPLRAAAREWQNRSDYARAESLLDRHAELLDRLGLSDRHPERLEGQIARAEILRRRGGLDRASSLAQVVRTVAAAEKQASIEARACLVQGFAEVERGEVAHGVEHLEQARARFEQLGDDAEASRALRAVGYAHWRRRELALGFRAYLRALELAQRAGDRLGIAAALGGAGISDPEHRPGDPARIGEALTIFEAHGNLYGMGSTLNSLAEVARAQGDLEEAETLYLRALAVAQKAGASHLEGIVIGNLAVVQMRQGAYADAYEELQLGLRRAERLGQEQLRGTLHVLSLAGAAEAGAWEQWDWHEREAERVLGGLETSEEDVAWAAERAAEIAVQRGEASRARAAYGLAAGHYRKLGRDADAHRCAARSA
ncbi:serine/threonine-protein kinase PknK [Sandaracinus amylolyticus]|uniref:serine/threonine-protein kinase n=1 Tax=Sandaracinus amylolyticus TaxID=927083 RepID=UPI001F0028C9|nr:protein kinase [Sandaracinus amylolyticus]UJR82171.1 Serine/threonine-protein kinase PknA [Sandaracinus amylolyticus]